MEAFMKKEEALGYLIGTSSRFFKRAINKRLKEFGITTSQCSVLRLIYNEGEMSQAEIASKLEGDKATIGSVIAILCDKGYLEKNVHEKDNRAYQIGLTAKSKVMMSDIEKMSQEVSGESLKGLSQEEIKVFYKVLNKMIENLAGGE